MKLLYSNVIELHEGWGAEYFLNKGFQSLGHETYCIDYRKYRYDLYRRFINADRCDAFLLQRGDGFPLPIVKSINLPRLFYTSELFSRCRDHDRLLKSGLFDHIFMRTPQCIEAVVSRGWADIERCSVLLSAFDESFHRKMPEIEKDIDVLHIGNVTARRRQILDLLAKHYKVTVVKAFGEEMVKTINRAKIVLNIHSEDYLDTETRVFEVLGCGSFLLTEKLSEENPFSDEDLVQAADMPDLIAKIGYYIENDREREKIAMHGHTTALSKHTYRERAAEIVDVLSTIAHKNNGTDAQVVPTIDFRLLGIYEPILRMGHKFAPVNM